MSAPHEIASNGDNAASDAPPMSLCTRTSPAGDGAIAESPQPAGAFWATLSKAEDLTLWAMRAEGHDFLAIRLEIETRRAFSAKQARNRANGWARKFREEYRRERGL